MIISFEEIKARINTFTLRFECRLSGGDLTSMEGAAERLIPENILTYNKVCTLLKSFRGVLTCVCVCVCVCVCKRDESLKCSHKCVVM